MRSVELRAYGDPSSGVHVVDLPEPGAPGRGEVLVAMAYAPVNLNDLLVMQGLFPVHPTLPSPIGNEGVGRVLAVGEAVGDLRVGDVVLLPLYSLTWRERLVVPATNVIAIEDATDLQQLSMLRINAVTAALLLSTYADLKPGDWVIQNAGNSAVARSVMAIAKARGLRTISLVRRPEVIDEVIAAGADAGLLDDAGASEKISALVGRDGIGLALDGVGGAAAGRLAAALRPRGTLVSYAILGGHITASVSSLDVIFKDLSYRGFYLDKPEYAEAIPAAAREAARLVRTGELNIPVAAVYPIDAVGAAIQHVQNGGKALLKFAG